MSWVCTVCLERHLDRTGIMGFGMCNVCQDKVRVKKAAILAAKKKKRRKVKK